MALIPCPECQTQVSDKAESCPKCGYPLRGKPLLTSTPASSPPPRKRIQKPVVSQPPLLPPLPPRPSTEYAGFWVRVFAFFIDQLIYVFSVATLLALVELLLGVRHIGPLYNKVFEAWLNGLIGQNVDDNHVPYPWLWKFLGYVIATTYFAGFESSRWQGTPGKRLLGLRVSDETGERISFGRAVWRYLSKYVSALILGIGFLMVAFTQYKQGLHDFMASTVVTHDNPLPDKVAFKLCPKCNAEISLLSVTCPSCGASLAF